MTQDVTAEDIGSLRPLGLTEFEERVYRLVLTRGTVTPQELAEEAAVSPGQVDRTLARLRELGLVSRLAGRRRRYTGVEPDTAIESLVRARTAELEQVRTSAVALSSVFHATQQAMGSVQPVELLRDSQELARWFVRLQQQVREEMLGLDRPPYALAASNPIERANLDQGVRWRAVYAPEALELPGAMAEIQELARRGEQARVLPGMPLKLAIADRRTAIMPLSLDLERAVGVVIHESTLLDALVDLFERYWAQAVPLGGAATAQPDGESVTPSDELVSLLAAGLSDSAIARQMGWSTRTMRRRMRGLFDDLRVDTRFQAGVQAARRGMI